MTPAALRALDVIRDAIERTGSAPTYGELMVALGLTSKSGVARLIGQLESSGRIVRLSSGARALALPGLPDLTQATTAALRAELARREGTAA